MEKGSKEGIKEEACPVEDNVSDASEVLCEIRVRVGVGHLSMMNPHPVRRGHSC
jgi:hypothetical protein